MKQILDINNWARKEHFHFFNQFEEPFFGVSVNIDCTIAYKTAKERGASFFLYYLHKSLLAANRVPAFRYRIEGQEVWIYDQVSASSTIGRADGTFGFSNITFAEDFQDFKVIAEKEISQVQNSKGLFPPVLGPCMIHYSALPWIDFTSVSHARSFSFKDSSPKISFGKMIDTDGKRTMSLSVHVHHALMDGYQLSEFIDCFQLLMNEE